MHDLGSMVSLHLCHRGFSVHELIAQVLESSMIEASWHQLADSCCPLGCLVLLLKWMLLMVLTFYAKIGSSQIMPTLMGRFSSISPRPPYPWCSLGHFSLHSKWMTWCIAWNLDSWEVFHSPVAFRVTHKWSCMAVSHFWLEFTYQLNPIMTHVQAFFSSTWQRTPPMRSHVWTEWEVKMQQWEGA